MVDVDGRALVVTCAHVVNAAIGRPHSSQGRPDAPLAVAPAFAPTDRVEVVVAADGWLPIADRGTGDVAILEFRAPIPRSLVPARLHAWNGRGDLPFQALGYPAGYATRGQQATGVIVGRFGPDGQWAQLDATTSLGHRITKGFSGTPVWDRAMESVVGIVVAEDIQGVVTHSGAMLPIEIVAAALPRVAPALQASTVTVPTEFVSALAQTLPGNRIPTVETASPTAAGITETRYDLRPGGSSYVARLIDATVDRRLRDSALVIVVGPSKAGKSRTAFEAARRVYPDHLFVAPRTRRAVERLVTDDSLGLNGRPVVVWLDELESYLATGDAGDGLGSHAMDAIVRRTPPWRAIATLRASVRHDLRNQTGSGRAMSVLEDSARVAEVWLSAELSDSERVEAEIAFNEDFSDGASIGERLIGGREMLVKLEGAANPFGWALTRAAIDWQRMGIENGIAPSVLTDLAGGYLRQGYPAAEPTAAAWNKGLEWALAPLASHVALLRWVDAAGERTIAPLDYLIAVADGQIGEGWDPVPPETWEFAATRFREDDLFRMLEAAHSAKDWCGVVACGQRARSTFARPGMAAFAAALTGRALWQLGRDDEAADAYRQAQADVDDAVRARGHYGLGQVLRRKGAAREASEEFARAADLNEEPFAGLAAIELGEIFEQLGATSEARDAYDAAAQTLRPRWQATSAWRCSSMRRVRARQLPTRWSRPQNETTLTGCWQVACSRSPDESIPPTPRTPRRVEPRKSPRLLRRPRSIRARCTTTTRGVPLRRTVPP
jgi:tetratricopeptide (TPR) repeat protein